MAKSITRKCSICRKTGHKKSTCLRAKKDVIAPDKVILATKKSSYVFVNVKNDVAPSPHIVQFAKDGGVPGWDQVSAYGPLPVQKQERVAVDFSKFVTEHNAAAQKRDIKLFREAIKKHIDHTLSSQARKEMIKKVQNVMPVVKKSPALFLKSSVQKKRFQPAHIQLNIQKKNNSFTGSMRSLFYSKSLAYTMIVLVILSSIPLPAFGYYHKMKKSNAYVAQESTQAFLALQASTVAAFQSNIELAGENLGQALTSFTQARSVLEKDYHLLLSVAEFLPIIGDQVKSRQHLLVSGHHLALGNTYLIKAMQQIQEQKDSAFTTKLGFMKTHLRSASTQYEQALRELQQVQLDALPLEHRNSFKEFRLLFATLVNDMEDIANLIDALQMVLGDTGFKRYLVVFQNHHELRATGGFVGSFAIVDVQKGKVQSVTVPSGGSYDLQGQLSVYVKPPLPLQLANSRWEFQDSNWFPDFEMSGQKMAWFYEHAREETVDGVVAINASVLERFLRIVGPVSDEKHNLMIADYDALEKIQTTIEFGPEKEINEPKAILSRLLEQLMQRLPELSQADMIVLLSELHEAAQQKEIQMYSRDAGIQKTFDEFGWTGKIHDITEDQDYLYVINTNIQGEKSDARMKQQIQHYVSVQEDGSVINTVVIKREHTGTPDEVLYGAQNVNYLRVYVPKGSELLKADGFTYPPENLFHVPEEWYSDDADVERFAETEEFHIDSGTRVSEEFGKTVFGNWVMTMPGEQSEITLVYKLPFTVIESKVYENSTDKWKDILLREYHTQRSRYSLVIQRQSGSPSTFSSEIRYPSDWVPVWRSSDHMDLRITGASYATTLDQDDMIGVVMEREIR